MAQRNTRQVQRPNTMGSISTGAKNQSQRCPANQCPYQT